MVFYKIITIYIMCFVYVAYVESIPTFGDEFVHIKVHVPNELESTRGYLKPKQPGSSQHTAPKVVHHFHRRRKPTKKEPKKELTPLLENVILAELDKPYQYDGDDAAVLPPIDETYIVKEEYDEEEHHYDDEADDNYHESQKEYGKENIETYKIIEDDEKQHKHHYHSNYQPQHVEKHIETVKLIEEKPHYNYQQHVAEVNTINYDNHKPHAETIHIIKSPKLENAYDHHHHHHETNHYNSPTPHVAKHHYEYEKPQEEILEIVKTKSTNFKGYSKPYQETTYNNYQSQDYHPETIKETIEIIKSKVPENPYYKTHPYNDYHQQPPAEIIKIKESKYSKPEENYHQYREPVKTNYYYSRQPETIVNAHIEYRKPSTDIQYFQPAQIDTYQTSNTGKPASGYYYGSPSVSSQSSSYGTPPQPIPFVPVQPERKPLYIPSSYPKYGEVHNYDNSYVKPNSFASDLHQHLPSIEEPPEFKNYKTSLSTVVRQNTLFDELSPSNVNWAGSLLHNQASETYTGYDSYSAGHVQGLGSGGFKYHPTLFN